jgi:hypothetical protein
MIMSESEQIKVHYTSLGPAFGCGRGLDDGESMVGEMICGRIAPEWVRDFTKGYGVDLYYKCDACYKAEKGLI